MQRLLPGERIALTIWLVVAAVVWNGLYDLLLTRGAKDYLYRAALHDSGRGPAVSLAQMMEVTVRDALWISTLWAGLILLAALVTLRVLRTP